MSKVLIHVALGSTWGSGVYGFAVRRGKYSSLPVLWNALFTERALSDPNGYNRLSHLVSWGYIITYSLLRSIHSLRTQYILSPSLNHYNNSTVLHSLTGRRSLRSRVLSLLLNSHSFPLVRTRHCSSLFYFSLPDWHLYWRCKQMLLRYCNCS